MIARAPVQRFVRRLARSRRGVALTEFAFALPIVLGVGCYGIECANVALANLKVSQIALNLADNAGRVGSMQDDNTSQLREVDINDVLTAARLQGEKLDLANRGRIVLSSLEEHKDSGGTSRQYIHWQRCLGVKSGTDWDSSYGTTGVSAGTQTGTAYAGTIVTGMGPTGSQITAPPDSGVMFVEISYLYNPVISAAWLPFPAERIHYVASFIVRDKRVFDQIYNPTPTATRYTCDKYTAT